MKEGRLKHVQPFQGAGYINTLVKEPEQLASSLLSSRLVLVHYTEGGGEHYVSESTCGKNVLYPLLEVLCAGVKARRDNSTFINSSDQLDDDLARPVIIDDLELSDVAY